MRCGEQIRELSETATSMEEVAGRVVRYFFDHLVDKHSGVRSCALARLYKTHPLWALDTGSKAFARNLAGTETVAAGTKCLTLMGTAGEHEDWNSRESSGGHRAIPLTSERAIQSAPMISQMIQQLGIGPSDILQPDPDLIVDLERRTYNVFHVAEAADSPYIPAQTDFVKPYGIRSVLGFGGVLPPGELFTVILFSKAPITREVAERFRNLAVSVKLALLPFITMPFEARPVDSS